MENEMRRKREEAERRLRREEEERRFYKMMNMKVEKDSDLKKNQNGK